MDIAVRLATKKDLPGLISLYRELHPQEAPLDLSAAEALWKDMKSGDLCSHYVAVYEDRVISSCSLAVIPNLTRGGRSYGVIENVITHPEHRREGAGKAVLKAAIAHARQRNCYKVMLMSGMERTEAHDFYHSLGFDGDRKKGFDMRL